MKYNIHVKSAINDTYFDSSLDADSLDKALEFANREMLEAYLTVPRHTPGAKDSWLITISNETGTMGTWSYTLNEPVPTPCGECGGKGGVDSGGMTPQGAGMMVPCPSCLEPVSAYHQTVCAVCDVTYKLEDLIGTCPTCRQAKTVLDAWQEAFGTTQLTHAMAEHEKHGEALNSFQNDTWASLNKYSNALGWGLSGMQPECWIMLDAAVEELRKRRQNDAQIIRIITRNRHECLVRDCSEHGAYSLEDCATEDRIIATKSLV